ncbi:MAG TPA: DNA polymerase III subunit gamma/tau [Firmicutes bacterium]|nr:DNA polymerase III subunit gamma/tau [Bacillota bacterium]
MDVIEIDAASNRGIDEIRDLREKVKFAPAEGKYKIYIIDEVHMLTVEAFNALLRTLEEPPQSVVFILATTEVHKIPLTILSRCQRFDFKRFTISEIKGRLQQILEAEGARYSEGVLELIAEHAEGGMRDAVSLLEQVLAHSREKLEESDVRAILGLIDEEELNRIAEAINSRDTAGALQILTDISLNGKDLFQFGRSLVQYYRNTLLTALLGENGKNGLAQPPRELVHIIEELAAATGEVKKSVQGTLPLELAFIKLTALQSDPADLEVRIQKLEALVKEGRFEFQTVSGKQADTHETNDASRKEDAVLKKASTPVPVQKAATAESGSACSWEQFLEAVKKKKRTLAALIQEGKPVQFTNELLVLGLPSNLKFHLENLSLPQNKEILEEILQELTGGIVKFSCVPVPLHEQTSESKQPLKSNEPEVLSKAVQLFGGEVRPVSKEEN